MASFHNLIRLGQLRLLLRIRPFDTSTAEGRAQERLRRLILTVASSTFAKIMSLATSLISIPLTLGYLGSERFGLWMAISSFIIMFAFADLGIGNGLLNAVSEAHGREDRTAIRIYIASALAVLSLIAAGILFVFFELYPFISWSDLFNLKSPEAAHDAGPALATFVVCFALSIPASVVQRVQMGLQRGYLFSLWQSSGSVLGLLCVITAIALHAGLPWLVLGMAGAPLMATALNGVVFFIKKCPDLRPVWSNVHRHAIKKIVHSGLLFFVLQIAFVSAYSSDNLIIIRILGPESVAQYAVVAKMFSVIPVVISLLLMPLWPAYGEAIARGDAAWVRRTFSRSVGLALTLSGIISAALVILGPYLLKLWIGPRFDAPFSLIAALGVWVVVEAVGNAYAMLLNGANIVREQVLIACIFVSSCLAARIFGVEEFGVAGIPMATALVHVLAVLLPYNLLVSRVLGTVRQPAWGTTDVALKPELLGSSATPRE